jgi:hypothetical protein
MASKAQQGRGTIIAIGTVPTTIGEVKSIKRSGNEWKTDDVTNLTTSGNSTEKITTIIEQGTYELGGNRVSSDAGQLALDEAFASGDATPFVITLPKTLAQTTKGDSYAFDALVLSSTVPPEIDVTKTLLFSAKLSITGPVTFTPGS